MDELVVPARLVFDPPNITKKHASQSTWKATAVALIDRDIARYYAWFIKQRFSLSLVEPLRGGHITFISDSFSDLKNFELTKALWHDKVIDVTLFLNVRTNGKYWWLTAYAETFDLIRKSLNLGQPFFNYHMTIGYPKKLDLEYSKYLYNYLTTYYK